MAEHHAQELTTVEFTDARAISALADFSLVKPEHHIIFAACVRRVGELRSVQSVGESQPAFDSFLRKVRSLFQIEQYPPQWIERITAFLEARYQRTSLGDEPHADLVAVLRAGAYADSSH